MSSTLTINGVEWVATQWMRQADHGDCAVDAPVIDRLRSPYYAGERYAVRRMGRCLNTEGEWEYEPMPSSRTKAFYRRCRFPTFESAVSVLASAEQTKRKAVPR